MTINRRMTIDDGHQTTRRFPCGRGGCLVIVNNGWGGLCQVRHLNGDTTYVTTNPRRGRMTIFGVDRLLHNNLSASRQTTGVSSYLGWEGSRTLVSELLWSDRPCRQTNDIVIRSQVRAAAGSPLFTNVTVTRYLLNDE